MPEQRSSRGDTVSKGTAAGPFETQLVRLGVGGLNLHDELDAIPPEQCSRLTNIDHDANGSITSRPGMVSLATAGTKHHSVRRMVVPFTGGVTRCWGIDTSVYMGATGALTVVDTGYSGDPLALAPHRPPLSGDPWMFVGDRFRMRKIRGSDNLDLPIGLPAPTVAASAALGTEYRKTLAECDAADGTDAANWVGTAGKDSSGNDSAAPFAADVAGPESGNAVYITTQVGSATSTYDSWMAVPVSVDASQLSPVSGGLGDIAASDQDIIHLWMKTSHPWLVRDLRIYFVVSSLFDPAVLPGTPDPSGNFANADAYVKSFRSNDFTQFIQAKATQIDDAETARIYALRDADQEQRAFDDDRGSWAIERAGADPGRNRSLEIGSGSHQWFELGSIGLSMRRGDFKRIGNGDGDWSTITGIVLYIKHDIESDEQIIAVAIDDLYLTGGYGPDTVEVGAQQYDYRYTHYDPRTGAESNGSPEMACEDWLDSRRQLIEVSPTAIGDSGVRQRIYRRGGALTADWYFVGVNAADGGTFTDTETDDGISAAGTLPTDHFQPVPTVDNAGTTILAQPLPALWGPIEGMLLGCGDPYRPGHLYWSLPDSPDHWSASSNKEICPPSEELMNGGLIGNQAFVFSRLRLYMLYPALSADATVDYQPSLCKRGIQSRWAFCTGPGGIYFAAEGEGVFVTQGGAEQWISKDVDPIFQGITRYGYLPIDWTVKVAIRLTTWENKLFVQYQDTGGTRRCLVYHLLQQFWRFYSFGTATALVQGEDEEILLLGGQFSGATYQHDGLSDVGAAIAASFRTGAFSAGRREEKLFADQILDADRQGLTLSVQNFLNEEVTADGVQQVTTGAGRLRYVLDGFGTTPESAHSISTELSWSSASAAPFLWQIGYSVALLPELTNKRVTNWDDLGSSDEIWLSGITLDVDTSNVARTILVERDYNGAVSTVATLTVQASGRHKLAFSWAAVPARQVRLRPTDANPWLIFRADWIAQPEPPRIAAWDIHFENSWDQYYTGLDLYCDTAGATKQIEVSVDGVVLTDAGTGLAFFSIVANGRKVVHLTFTPGRGHVFRFRALDANPGLLYDHRWHLEAEPSEQANWNQNFSVYGSRADKYLKAVIFECDTFGQNKSVQIEADGVVVETLSVNANGRKVVQKALTIQQLGRVWRLLPADQNPGRLYSAQPVFDEEPFQLTRWETQETNYGLPGWFAPLYGHLVLKATAPVTLTLTRQYNQRGGSRDETYTIPATGGVKSRQFVTFAAGKDVLHKWVLTSTAPFFLYREETEITIQPWGADSARAAHPFGDDDLDPTRPMTNAAFAAETAGGALGR